MAWSLSTRSISEPKAAPSATTKTETFGLFFNPGVYAWIVSCGFAGYFRFVEAASVELETRFRVLGKERVEL